MSSLRNIKERLQVVRQNGGILATDQVQIVTRAAVPTDSNLANGRLVYVTGTGLRAYVESGWVTLGATGGSSATWNGLYDSGKTMTIDNGTMTFAGATALGTGDVLTITAAAAVSGDCIQITNSGSGSDIKGTSSTWSVSAAGAAIFNASVTSPAIVSYGAGGNANLTIDAKGSGTITLGATSTGAITLTRATSTTAALTVGTTLTVTGGADADRFIITAGDVLISDGHITMVQPDRQLQAVFC
jgi:hypothetical protein